MSLPVWTALHAYVVGTRVTPVTPPSPATTWQVSTAGTSGAVEPTWPTTEPWTVTDGTVHWALATSVRVNATAGVNTVLTNFKTANPTLVFQLATARPKSLSNASMPLVYIAGRDETMTVGTGLRSRNLSGLAVAVVDVMPDNAEAEARMDILIDGLVDAFTAAYHGIDGYSILQPVSVTEFDPDPGGGTYLLGNLISLGASFKTEGRQ